MSVVIIPDLHEPFCDRRKLSEVLTFIKAEKPEHVVCIGDAFDQFSLSRFPKDYYSKGVCAADELGEAYDRLKTMWATIKKDSPKSKCWMIRGNHDVRLQNRIVEKLPEIVGVFNIKQFWEFKGVNTIYDPRAELIIDGVVYTHGHYTTLGQHCKMYLKPVVCGHSHRPGLFYMPLLNGDLIWELNVGHLAKPDSEALRYTPKKYTNWVQGFGYIDELGPRFIPL